MSTADPAGTPQVYLGLQLGLCVDAGALTQLLQLLAVLGRLTQPRHEMEALSGLRVCLLLQLHGVAPGSLGLHQNQQQVP